MTTPSLHTPGPWTASADSSFIRDSRGVGIAKVYAWCGRSGDGPLPHKANGELIASAPAMRERIEALEKALRLVTAWESGWRMEEADYLESHPSNAGLADHRIRFGVPREEQLQEAIQRAREVLSPHWLAPSTAKDGA